MAKLRGPQGYLLAGVDSGATPTEFEPLVSNVLATILASGPTAWFDLRRVTDVEGNFSDNKVDTTDREAARERWQEEDIVTRKGEKTFTIFNDPSDKLAQLLIAAWDAGIEVPLWDLDQNPYLATDAAPVKGFLANFTLGMRESKPIQGMQTFQVTASAVGYSKYQFLNATSGAALGALSFDANGALVDPTA